MTKLLVALASSVALSGALLLLPPEPVHASFSDIWVAQTGSPHAPGASCQAPGFVGSSEAPIQAAVDAASAGATIHICPGTYTISSAVNSTINLTGTSGITLSGAGIGISILDGGNTFASGESNDIGHRILYAEETNFSVDNLTFQNAYSTPEENDGGAIRVAGGNLAVNLSSFRNNVTEWSGAAIRANQVSVASSMFISNTGAALYQGSAIEAWGESTIKNSVFIGNAGADTVIHAFNTTITIDCSVIANNVSLGAIVSSLNFTLTNSTVAGNASVGNTLGGDLGALVTSNQFWSNENNGVIYYAPFLSERDNIVLGEAPATAEYYLTTSPSRDSCIGDGLAEVDAEENAVDPRFPAIAAMGAGRVVGSPGSDFIAVRATYTWLRCRYAGDALTSRRAPVGCRAIHSALSTAARMANAPYRITVSDRAWGYLRLAVTVGRTANYSAAYDLNP